VTVLLQDLTVAIQVAFGLLAIATLADWIRRRDAQRPYLVLALVFLALVVLIGPNADQLGVSRQPVTDITLVIFLLSGYFLLLFRDSLIPLGASARVIITVGITIIGAVGIAAGLPSDPNVAHTPFQVVALSAVVATWIVCVAEPILRLGRASIGRPAVEGSRLRALSLGYAGLIAVVLVGTLASSLTQNQGVVLATDVVALLVVPLLYASFSPPVWLRRLWSQPEEDEFRGALHDLLLYTPDRAKLAERALDWSTRLVGGASGFIVDSDGKILVSRGMTTDEVAQHSARAPSNHSTLVVPLDLAHGKGSMTIVAGPFTPLFGQDEVFRLRQYAGSITAGLDRVSLTDRLAALEKAKSEFLNIASHELRGPMTVIKGYLTMIAAGSLGDVPPKTKTVLPLLIAKSDEVNSLLEQMIEASRLEDGRMALKKERSDITELTDAAIENLRPLLSDHELKVDMPPRPVWADVDPDRFQIVVRNLVSNAVKYSPSGSRVRVRIKPNGAHAMLSVTDEGIGIAVDDQPRLFTRFGRIENKATAHTSGTGLGLWLSREIARMHDGDLTVESETGRGSTFKLDIPLDRG